MLLVFHEQQFYDSIVDIGQKWYVLNEDFLVSFVNGFIDRTDLYHGVKDRIHQGRRMHLLPPMGAVVKALNDHRGCRGAFISGAGPAVAAFTSGDGQKLGELGIAEFSKEGIPAEARILAPDYLGLTYD